MTLQGSPPAWHRYAALLLIPVAAALCVAVASVGLFLCGQVMLPKAFLGYGAPLVVIGYTVMLPLATTAACVYSARLRPPKWMPGVSAVIAPVVFFSLVYAAYLAETQGLWGIRLIVVPRVPWFGLTFYFCVTSLAVLLPLWGLFILMPIAEWIMALLFGEHRLASNETRTGIEHGAQQKQE